MSPTSATPTPRLREGLEPRERGGLVHVASPTTGREHALREEEWQLALHLDGRRTLRQLHRRARRLGVPATPETLESFIRELAARGLLEGGQPPPFALRGWPEEKQRRVQEALAALKDARFGEARELLEQELRRSPGCEELQAMLEGVRRAEVDASSEQDEQWALAEAVRAAGEGLMLPTPLAVHPGPGPARDARPARRWIVAAGAAVALIAAFIVPLPDSVSGECALAPAHLEVVRATVPGRLERVLVADGARVHRGDLLAQLADPELVAKLESAAGAPVRPHLRAARPGRGRGRAHRRGGEVSPGAGGAPDRGDG
jgi:biotin carboxyl carrier protein